MNYWWRLALMSLLPALCLVATTRHAIASIVVLPAGEVKANAGSGLAFDVMLDVAHLNQPTYPWSGGALLGIEFSIAWDSTQWKISQSSLEACGRSFNEADPLCAYRLGRPSEGFDWVAYIQFIAGYGSQGEGAGPISLEASPAVLTFLPALDGFVVSNAKDLPAVDVSLYEVVLLRADGTTVDVCSGITDWCGYPSGSSHPLPRSSRALIVPND